MIKILFFATIRDYTNEKETTVEGASVKEVRGLLRLLCDRYGTEFRDETMSGDNISDKVIILVNGKHIAHTGGILTSVNEGDTIAIFPVIGGG